MSAKRPSTKAPAPENTDSQALAWANRGWYLALEYKQLPGKDRFQKRLKKFKELGRFQELLEAGGQITYRNLFRIDQLKDAWKLMTALKGWRQKVKLYLNGEELSWKDGSQIVWCAAYLAEEQPCRGDFEARRYEVGCDRKIDFAPFQWERRDDDLRHALSFAKLDEQGLFQFDTAAIQDYLSSGPCSRFCPLSLTRHQDALAQAFSKISLESFEWPVLMTMSEDLQKKIGKRSLDREHAFSLIDKGPSLFGSVELELFQADGQNCVTFIPGQGPETPISKEVSLSKRLHKVLDSGHRLRILRTKERYCSEANRRNEVEQVFEIKNDFMLELQRSPGLFPGFVKEALPQSSEGYKAWAKQAMEALKLTSSKDT